MDSRSSYQTCLLLICFHFSTTTIYDNNVETSLETFREFVDGNFDLNDQHLDYSRISKRRFEMNIFPYPPSTDQVIRNEGYPCEIHDITTEDGYILRVFRIPRGRKAKNIDKRRPPLLLQHGILCSSDCWILSDPSRALGFRLADEGYDVWIGNNRGTTYSKNHTTLNSDDPKYWNFSLHELGTKDLPAVIDYMLNATGQNKISYVGHSQGTTQFFILTSVLPEYNDKILVMSALAPVAFLDHIKGITNMLAHISKLLEFLGNTFGFHDMLDRPTFVHVMNHLLCAPKSIFLPLCEYVFFVIVGFDSNQLDKKLVEDIADYCPAGCSLKQLEHFSQFTHMEYCLLIGCSNFAEGRFTWFDYGAETNIKVYNSSSPPQYNLTRITAPVVLHYSTNDYIATEPEVQRLAWILPNVAAVFRVPYEKFNHIDFMWATDANKLLYNTAIKMIKSFL